MAKKDAYQEYLQQNFGNLIEGLSLPELQKHFMQARWLDQLLWMEGQAKLALFLGVPSRNSLTGC